MQLNLWPLVCSWLLILEKLLYKYYDYVQGTNMQKQDSEITAINMIKVYNEHTTILDFQNLQTIYCDGYMDTMYSLKQNNLLKRLA